MNTSIAHLPSLWQQQLQEVTKIIRAAVRPEKIILFGTFAEELETEEGYAHLHFMLDLCGFDILIVTRNDELRREHDLQDKIEGRCRFVAPVNILVHDMAYINASLSEGHTFFYQLIQEGVLLYGAGSIPFTEGVPPDPVRTLAQARQDYSSWSHRAQVFYQNACFNQGREEWAIATFQLHQAVEQAYQTILLVYTGYKAATHNLDKLRRYTCRISLELAFVFRRHMDEEDRLFKLLCESYIGARYKWEYSVRKEELEVLTTRTSKLLLLMNRLCENRFSILRKIHPSG